MIKKSIAVALSVTLLIGMVGCGSTDTKETVVATHGLNTSEEDQAAYDARIAENEYNTEKETWLKDKFSEYEQKVSVDTVSDSSVDATVLSNIQIAISNKYMEVPFTGADITESGFVESITNNKVEPWVSTFGTTRSKSDNEEDINLDCGFINNSSEELSQEDCYVAVLCYEGKDIGLILNEDVSSKIKYGETLENTLVKLNSVGVVPSTIEFKSSLEGISQYLNIKDTLMDDELTRFSFNDTKEEWTITIHVDELTDAENIYPLDDTCSEEFRTEFGKEFRHYDVTLHGNITDGLDIIRYEYTYEDVNTLSRVYDQMNK